MFIHAIFQPYKKKFYNRVDFFIFAIISIVNSLYAYSEFLRTQNVSKNTIQTYLWIRTLLAWIPIVFIMGYILFKLSKRCNNRDKQTVTMHNNNGNEFLEPLLDRVDYDDDDDDDN